MKSLAESVRLQTLSRAGLQQLQLDVHYLRPLLRRSANLSPSLQATFHVLALHWNECVILNVYARLHALVYVTMYRSHSICKVSKVNHTYHMSCSQYGGKFEPKCRISMFNAIAWPLRCQDKSGSAPENGWDNCCRFAQGSEANAIHQLLDEVLSTALERALEPQLLEGMVLENIMNAYGNKG